MSFVRTSAQLSAGASVVVSAVHEHVYQRAEEQQGVRQETNDVRAVLGPEEVTSDPKEEQEDDAKPRLVPRGSVMLGAANDISRIVLVVVKHAHGIAPFRKT